MEEKKIDKKKMIIQGLTCIVIFGVGYKLGQRVCIDNFDTSFEIMGKTGITASKIINGSVYDFSITQRG